MNTKRWSVWLCLLTLVVGLRGARAQESDTPLIDDVSKPTAKAVKDLPLPANGDAKAQIQIDFVMWDVDGQKLGKILGDSKEPVIEFIQRNGIELPTKRGPEPLVHVLRKPLKFDVRGKDVSSAFKKLTAPTVMTLSGQEATVLSGGALPVPLPTDALGSREVVMREFGQKFVVKPVWLNEGKIFIDLTAEDSRLTDPVVSVGDAQVPSIFSRRVSATCNLQPGETLLILNGPTESAFIQLVEVTPRVANDPQPVILANPPKATPPAPQATARKPQSAPKTPDNSKPVGVLKGQGVNSDAGVVGNIVLQNKDQQTRLEATSLTLDVPKVVNLGVEIGQAGALMECGNPHNPARLIAPVVVLEDTKGPNKSEDGFLSATATLKLTSNAAFESIQNRKPESDRQIFLVPIPEGQKALDRTQAQRIFEHAFFRVLARNEADHSEKQPWQVAEIAQGQKMVRVPVKHEVYMLLPTPTGNVPGFRYVAAAKSEHGGAKRIAGLTVLFVSESVSQLESLIEALEPTAVVTVIEVREAVVLRGTVTDEAQKKSLIEIAEQLYPKVLDQLKAQAPSAEIGRAVPHPERLNASPTKMAVIQQVAGEDFAEPPLAAKKEAPLRSEKRQSPQIVPGKLPTVEELKELRDDIKGLRQDVQRLSELMERDRKTSAATKSAEAAKAEALTRGVEAAKDALVDIDPKEVVEHAWQVLGLRLVPLNDDQLNQISGTQYRGGMLITEVREPQAREKNGLKAGDILVGLHQWETITLRNVDFVLSHPDREKFSPLKFFVIRDGEKMWGHLPEKVVTESSEKRSSPLAAEHPATSAVEPARTKLDLFSMTVEGSSDEFIQFGRGHERGFSLAVGDRRTMTVGHKFLRIDGFDPSIIEITASTPQSIQASGRKPGITSFVAATENAQKQSGASTRFTVVVGGRITCNFEDEGLDRVIKSLAEQSQLNITLDPRGLDEEGIQRTQPINIALKDVSVPSALKLILEPLNLAVVVEEGVLVVTSKQRAKGELLVKAYAVADLVVPLPANPLSNELNPDTKPKHNSQALMDLVKTTIQPNTWDEMGGAGSLRFNDATLSLVIRTTANVHQEITELLSQLRKLHDTQVTVEMSIISIRDDLVPREINGSTEVSSLVLTQTARQSFVEKWQADRLTNIIAAPKITLFNGQTASLSSNELSSKDHVVNLVMNGTASGDRKSVRLSLGINGESFDTAIRRQQETLQEGQSLILDITDDISAPAELLKKLPIATDSDEARDILESIRPKDGSRVLLLVTPKVIVVEEEELRATP